MAKSVISFDVAWQKDHSCGYTCALCEDDIFGETFRMELLIGGKIAQVKRELPRLCPSCFDLYKSEISNVQMIE